MTTQVNWEVGPRMVQHGSTTTSHLRDFTRINPLMFFGSYVDENPQYFIDEFCKILFALSVIMGEKDELASYKLKDVARTWYTQWRENRVLRGGPLAWEIFKRYFLDRLFPRELRASKVEEFINLR